MSDDGLVLCHFGCGTRLNPNDPQVWRGVHGWERKTPGPSRKGGSDIRLRQPVPEYACDDCIDKQKAGLSPAQGALEL